MFKSRFLLPLSFVLLAAIGFTGCTDDPCENVDCGAGGIPQENTVFGGCECICDDGFELVGGTCVTNACNNVECGLGTPMTTAGGDCFCECPEGTENLGDGNGCVEIVECDETTCINGDCDDGTCDCDEAFEGEDCNTLSASKFIGTWSVVENCTATDPAWEGIEDDAYTVIIAEDDNASMTIVTIAGFFGAIEDQTYGTVPLFPNNVRGEIAGDTMEVELVATSSEFFNYTTAGVGVYSIADDGTETIAYEYVVNDRDDQDITFCILECSAVWTKQ